MSRRWDAVVVGGGPNGLAAAVHLAAAGHSVVVFEARDEAGGGARSEALTLPGFVHDVCSAVHPLAPGSPALEGLEEHGLRWIHPEAPVGHALDGGGVVLERDLEAATAALGEEGPRWARLVGPVARRWKEVTADVLGFRLPPRSPLTVARLGAYGLWPATALARLLKGPRTRALLAGCAGHSFMPLDRAGTGAFGLLLSAAAHAVGWPMPEGGAGRVAWALQARLQALGGEVRTGTPVGDLGELPEGRTILLDLTPRQVLRVAGARLPDRYRRALGRWRYGPSAFKVDWALSAPIPWSDGALARAGTVHLGGPLAEVAAAESAPHRGRVAERPFVLLTQPTLFDPSRAPPGRHVAWGYAHLPLGSEVDLTERIEAQVERFAPGFRDRILARAVRGPAELESHNANLVGGDISGGTMDLRQLLLRPAARWPPWSTPVPGLYLCSASTPPGPGVHGMCGLNAARLAVRRLRGEDPPRAG